MWLFRRNSGTGGRVGESRNCFEKHRSVGGKNYHLIMKGMYSETEDCKVLWKYRQVVCILCDRESKASEGMEWALEQQPLQLPSHWM